MRRMPCAAPDRHRDRTPPGPGSAPRRPGSVLLALAAFATLASLPSVLGGCFTPRAAAPRRPNVLLIVADDLGWGDLGCYGQRRVPTPRLDQLAAEGLRFTEFYAGSTVCAPSRCVLMTGLHTGHASIRGNSRQNLAAEEVTVAEVLRDAGYATGLVGKWGLGHEGSDGVPTRQGFESFFGYLNQRHAHNFYPSFLIRGEERVPLDNVVPDENPDGSGVASVRVTYSHDLFVDEALAFLDTHAEVPFFLTFAATIPHANNEAGAAGMEVPGPGPLADAPDLGEPARGFAAMVARLDRDVGRLVDRLEELGIAEDTLVLFTSDNGPHSEGGHSSATFDSNGPLRGQKRDLTEGGIRVPLIARRPGHVPHGWLTDHVSGFQDVLPTLADLAGVLPPADLDGISFLPTLEGRRDQVPHDHLYWAFYERGGGQALRRGRWKVVQQPYRSPPRLYDLHADPGEEQDLAAEHPDLLEELVRAMEESYEPSERWRFPD